MEPRDDEACIRRAQAGDRQAFAELVQRWWGPVFRWLHGVVGCAHRAEDLTQETFVKVWRALSTYQAGCFRAWLYRIARNCAIDNCRAGTHAADQPLPDGLTSAEPGPLGHLESQESAAVIARACAALPTAYRAALLLWVQEEMPYAEIAQVLGVTEATARWRVHKARRLLMQALGSHLDRNNS